MDETQLAAFLALLAGIHSHKKTNNLSPEVRGERCRQINRYGILSLSAIAAVVGCSVWQAEQAIVGMPRPKARGTLNPQHISMLAYVLSTGKVRPAWVRIFLDEGTSMSTVSDLTGISASTLFRHRRNIEHQD